VSKLVLLERQCTINITECALQDRSAAVYWSGLVQEAWKAAASTLSAFLLLSVPPFVSR